MNVISVENAVKVYGSSPVLTKLDLKIGQGSIFVLLGSSGCGKTTLLSCLVGSRKLDSGTIKIFNEPVGWNKSKIGYMPQELALVEEFSTTELIFFFGKIHGLHEQVIFDRFYQIKELLELSNVDEQIKNLSGGQKRRVSLAVTLVHQPRLVILDEPTVGLDPVLRWKIWDYLKFIAGSYGTTVLITTHYFEEARNADKIGFLRKGHLIAEDAPNFLLQKLAVNDLEQAFVALCEGQERISVNCCRDSRAEQKIITKNGEVGRLMSSQQNAKRKNSGLSLRKFKALLRKNFKQTTRRPVALGFLIFTPLLCLIAFYLTVGTNPMGLKIGVVNEEVQNFTECANPMTSAASLHNFNCYVNKISCRFLNLLNDSIAEKYFYENSEEAFDDVRSGKISGVIKISSNFTSTVHPFNEWIDLLADEESQGQIEVFLDQSDRQITFFLKQKLFELYEEFMSRLMMDCGRPKKAGLAPIHVESIFGSLQDEMQRSMTPGIIISLYFFLASIVTSTNFICDRLDGIWDRVLLADVQPHEILLSHVINSSLILIFQSFEFYFVVLYVFKIEIMGCNWIVMSLLLLIGLSAIMYGLAVSILSNDFMTATFMSSLIFYPMVIMCGIFWPLEAIPWYFRYVAYCLPFTLPTVALRDVLYKGYNLLNRSVQIGFGVIILWVGLSVVLCVVGLKKKKFRQ